jgi:hypothetical protein
LDLEKRVFGLVLAPTGTIRPFGGLWQLLHDRSGDNAMSTQFAYEPADFYVWRASDGFAIHLSLNVVTQLTALISRAGAEAAGMRGILLGRTIDSPVRTTVIEDFLVITPVEPAEDSSPYSIQDEDAPLEIACRTAEAGKEQRALGFFGVQREGRLNLRARDLETFSRLFCETGKVALMIQTSRRGNESDAALFYWQNGGAYPRDFGFAFPLEAAQLAEGHPGWRYPDPLEGMETPQIAPPAPPAPMPEVRPQAAKAMTTPPRAPARRIARMAPEGIRWSHLLPTAALVVAGICALQLATNSNHSVSAAPSPGKSLLMPSAASGTAGNLTPLGLAVTSRPHQLEIRWNRSAAPITSSERGVMKITEAGVTQAIPFDQRQLRDGYVAYTPTTTDVQITFDVAGLDGAKTTESLHAVAIP